MRRMRICIYGGTNLAGTPPKFVSQLAYEILKSIPAVIVTGGFKYSHDRPEAISTDMAALEGARRYAEEHSVPLQDHYQAWVPEPSLDGRRELQGLERMTKEEGIDIRVMRGRTALGRRLAMVADVDLVITISGKRHTEIVGEQALELGIPFLPIPFVGGDSEELFRKYRNKITSGFDNLVFDELLEDVRKYMSDSPATAARSLVKLIETAKVGKCLILLPFDKAHSDLYESIIEPTVSNYMSPIRLDHLPGSDAIYPSFSNAVNSSSAIIADITQFNENVMYEVGFAHGCKLRVLIYTQNESRIKELPLYFRNLNVQIVDKKRSLKHVIEEYLSSVKNNRYI